jgi:DNA-binding transcriptional regulator/RsmH inhibitor MraZ
LIPQKLQKIAGLEKDVTITGTGNHAEIWATDIWEAMSDTFTDEVLASSISSSGLKL